ncbi:MAG: hypothetical protein M3083_18150 [Actinomycetota bacterium]|nr:hypothetical protein [Actinomycetota bacterium]
MADVVVGISGLKCVWATTLRGHIHDHVSGMEAISVRDPAVIVDGVVGVDVIVVDDVVCLFDAADVGAAGHRDIRCIGLHDDVNGRGEDFLRDLGVDLVLSTATPPAQIVESIRRLAPTPNVRQQRPPDRFGPSRHRPLTATTPAAGGGPAGVVTVVSGVSGGVGKGEATILLAERMSSRATTVVIEADEMAPSMASRLGLQPDRHLSRALGLVAHGHPVFPDGLTPGRDDGAPHPRLGWDVVVGSTNPGGPPPANPIHFRRLVESASDSYGEVIVEIGAVVSATGDSGHDRFAAGRAALDVADRVVAIAAPNPEGVTRMLNWLSVVRTLVPDTPAWAVFGLVPRSRYVRAQLGDTLRSKLDLISWRGFESVHLLPLEAVGAKAAWNGLIPAGGLRRAVNALADEMGRYPVVPRARLDQPARAPRSRPVRTGR